MVSDNDLFKSAAPAKPKASLRTGLGQPKRVRGRQVLPAPWAGGACLGCSPWLTCLSIPQVLAIPIPCCQSGAALLLYIQC